MSSMTLFMTYLYSLTNPVPALTEFDLPNIPALAFQSENACWASWNVVLGHNMSKE